MPIRFGQLSGPIKEGLEALWLRVEIEYALMLEGHHPPEGKRKKIGPNMVGRKRGRW